MKKKAGIFLLGLALCAPTAIAIAQQNKAEQMYQQALFEMEGKGEYAKAIESFNQVMTQFPKEKTTAAMALLNIGRCYEKLGKNEAQKAYERILKEFKDQPQVVAEARMRLAALKKPDAPSSSKGISFRKLWSLDANAERTGAISADGRFFSFVDWKTGANLFIRDLTTGESRRLTKDGDGGYSKWAGSSRFSFDGKQIAYAWGTDSTYETYELRVIAVDGSEPRVIYHNDDISSVLWPSGWSRDGKKILIGRLHKKTYSTDIAMISIADGTSRVVTLAGTWTPGTTAWYPGISMSPDGRWVAYDKRVASTSDQRDIYVVAVDGSSETQIVDHPANDFGPVWTPDGDRILFVSDRSGKNDLYMITMANGKAAGAPELVRSEIGDILPRGITEAGAFCYELSQGQNEVYVATIDQATCNVVSQPTPIVHTNPGFNQGPDWSPDGKYLAYLSQRLPLSRWMVNNFPWSIVIHSREIGEEREVPSKVMVFPEVPYWISWSPDGKSILAPATDTKVYGIYSIDVETGESTLIREAENPLGKCQWLPDGRHILFINALLGLKGWDRQLIVRDIQTGEERELCRGGFCPARSPDGKEVAVWKPDNQRAGAGVVLIIDVATGKSREVLRLNDNVTTMIVWSHDGRFLIFGRYTGPDKKTELWKVPSGGGEMEKIGLTMGNIAVMSMSPDGKQIAFDVKSYSAELWVMENFLPKAGEGKK